MVWFCFCFAAAFPPLVGLLSAFSSLHGMLHSFPLLGIFHLFFPSCFTASTGSLLPLGDVGDYWVGHLFPPHPRQQLRIVPRSEFSQVFSLLVSKHSESQPRGVQLLTWSLVEGGGLLLAQITRDLLFSLLCLPNLYIQDQFMSVCLSLPFFILVFPFLLLRYVKYSQ